MARPEQVISVEWLDLPTSEDLVPAASLLGAWRREVIPGEPATPPEELEAGTTFSPANRRERVGYAIEGADVLGAVDYVSEDVEGRRRDVTVNFLVVRPGARRRGAGSLLPQSVVESARKDGRSRLVGSAPAGDEAARAFSLHHRARPELLEQQNRLKVADLDRELVDGWVTRAAERAPDYSLMHVRGPCPDDLLPEYARLHDVMNTAPHGPNLEDLILTAGDVRALHHAMDERGFGRSTLIARHDHTGELAGFTELVFSPFRPWLAFQWNTGVSPDHRNRGLGRWLKAQNALRVLDDHTDVEQVETWNAKSNDAMLSINRAMGFRTVAEWQAWELAV